MKGIEKSINSAHAFSKGYSGIFYACFVQIFVPLLRLKWQGVNKNTPHQLYGRFRARVVQLTLDQSKPFTGEVEIDESYFGARRVRGKRGRGASGKIPVVGLLKRGGCVYFKIVDDCSRDSLRPIIKGQVLTNSTVYTDGWRSYDGLGPRWLPPSSDSSS